MTLLGGVVPLRAARCTEEEPDLTPAGVVRVDEVVSPDDRAAVPTTAPDGQ